MKIDLNNIRLVKDSDGANFCYALYYGEESVGGIRINKVDYYEILGDEFLEMTARKVNSMPKYYLDFFIIPDEFRKMGLGRRIISEVIKDFGSYTIFLKAKDDNGMGQENLVRMYERYGFVYCVTGYDGEDYMIRPGNVQNGDFEQSQNTAKDFYTKVKKEALNRNYEFFKDDKNYMTLYNLCKVKEIPVELFRDIDTHLMWQ